MLGIEGNVRVHVETETWRAFVFCFFSCLFVLLFIFWLHPTASGILVPWPEIKHAPPALEVRSLTQWTTRELLKCGEF